MPQLSTGFVIAGAYADKLRRVLFAQLREKIRSGEVDNKTVAARAGELNRLLFDIIVNKLKLDKGDVVRIRIEYDVKDGDVLWKLDTLRVEAFRRIPDEQVARAVKETLAAAEEVLRREVTEEERAWTEAREREVEREVQRRTAEARARAAPAEKTGFDVASAEFYGETITGEAIAILKNSEGSNIGLAIVEGLNGSSRATIILVPEKGKAYRTVVTLDKSVKELKRDPSLLAKTAAAAKYLEIPREEAENLIRQKLEQLT